MELEGNVEGKRGKGIWARGGERRKEETACGREEESADKRGEVVGNIGQSWEETGGNCGEM